MSKVRFTLQILAVAVFTLTVVSIAQAQATRTWVSGVGDDVNPCSRTAPCKTFAGAISKTAANGEIDALDPGGFGAVTITKSITIDGTNGAGFGSILASLVNGVNVNDSATGSPNTIVVVLRRLSIQGAGNGLNGINFTSGKAVTVEDCLISGFKGAPGNGINMSSTAASSNAQLVVRNTSIHDNAGSGIFMSATGAGSSATAVLDRVRMSRSANGLTTNAGPTRVTMNDCVITLMSGPGNGVNLAGGSPIVHIEHSNISHNVTGIAATVGGARISDVYMTNNTTSITNPGAVRSWGDNKIFENGTDNQAGGAGLTKQ
jgi:hypothetical protein